MAVPPNVPLIVDRVAIKSYSQSSQMAYKTPYPTGWQWFEFSPCGRLIRAAFLILDAALELELANTAFGGGHVIPTAQIHRLVKRAAGK